jgi:hypothetical protein
MGFSAVNRSTPNRDQEQHPSRDRRYHPHLAISTLGGDLFQTWIIRHRG